ncbi:undecaprenyl-diphosphatase UppP [Methanobrevibacter sp. DSM 116169]|uniref:undecaprenyl-diphosphatase UppP n=1 Tax=Methanobrevibacter sp. DSM 116169 TaxID=3242727 RepID=UPI0038FC5C16
MEILEAIIIGIVQGLTEFLPVSSSAHLIFAQHFFGVNEVGLAFDTLVHLATLVAVISFFYKDIIKLLQAWWLSIGDILQKRFQEGYRQDPYKRMAWLVILASVPIGFVGVFLKSEVESVFSAGLFVPAFFLFVTGTILYLSQRMNKGTINFEKIGLKESIFMGLAQACAILPGLSRSGTTISAGLVAGLDKEFAAKFSFIMSIPAILGATLVQITSIGSALSADFLPMLLGFIAAAVSGYLAIRWLLELIQNRSLDIFAYYCWIVGIIVFMASMINII